MNNIIPTILTAEFSEFKSILNQLTKTEIIFPAVQIDVMDGIFVSSKSFSERNEINQLSTDCAFELHLMTAHPRHEISTWHTVRNIRKAIIPVESSDDIISTIQAARACDWSVELALKHETPLSAIDPYIDHIDSVLFLTVVPGAQGNAFIPAVGEKIKTFKKHYTHMTCSADGGITPDNINLINSWGVDYFCVGSALVKQSDIKSAYAKLINSLENN